MTKFFEQVCNTVEKIPIGRVFTYADVAKMMGRPKGAAMSVKSAMSAAISHKPDDFPWHRVVFLDGRLPNDELGEIQRSRLIKDGVGFTEKGYVDVEKYRWKPKEFADSTIENEITTTAKSSGKSKPMTLSVACAMSDLGDFQTGNDNQLEKTTETSTIVVKRTNDNTSEKTFFEQVYNIVKKIPIGMVSTYGDIAKMLGRSTGIPVKFAMNFSGSRTPDDFPWHRVVFFNGRIPQTERGEMQRDRLIKEGVGFTEKDCVDVEKYRWQPEELTNRIIEDEEQLELANKVNNAIHEFQKNLQELNIKWDIRKEYMEIDSLIKELKHPTPEMLNFIEQVRSQIEEKIHDSIALFKQKTQTIGYNDQKEYVQICLFIKQLKEPTQEMLDFVDEQILEKYIENKIKEFNSNLYRLSNSFDFSEEYTEICNLINKINGQAAWMLDFMRIDINKIITQQENRAKLPHRFSSRKYIPSRKWDEWESKYTKAVIFSKELSLNYKKYLMDRVQNQKAFDDINNIFFRQLTDVIQQLRNAFGYDINIVLCACPSSKPGKTNTIQLSITEYAKINKNVVDGNDLFVKIHQTEPLHLSSERDFDTMKDSIRLNEQKYTEEFFKKRNVFVICDDVYTTGTTVEACKWHLKSKQVIENSIFVCTIAETVEVWW